MDAGAIVNPALIRSGAGSPAVLSFMRVAPGMSRALNAAQQEMLSAIRQLQSAGGHRRHAVASP
jgi:hypothetical protein